MFSELVRGSQSGSSGLAQGQAESTLALQYQPAQTIKYQKRQAKHMSDDGLLAAAAAILIMIWRPLPLQ